MKVGKPVEVSTLRNSHEAQLNIPTFDPLVYPILMNGKNSWVFLFLVLFITAPIAFASPSEFNLVYNLPSNCAYGDISHDSIMISSVCTTGYDSAGALLELVVTELVSGKQLYKIPLNRSLKLTRQNYRTAFDQNQNPTLTITDSTPQVYQNTFLKWSSETHELVMDKTVNSTEKFAWVFDGNDNLFQLRNDSEWGGISIYKNKQRVEHLASLPQYSWPVSLFISPDGSTLIAETGSYYDQHTSSFYRIMGFDLKQSNAVELFSEEYINPRIFNLRDQNRLVVVESSSVRNNHVVVLDSRTGIAVREFDYGDLNQVSAIAGTEKLLILSSLSTAASHWAIWDLGQNKLEAGADQTFYSPAILSPDSRFLLDAYPGNLWHLDL